MKKLTALCLVMMLALTGCSGGVSQAEYDKVVAERDALLAQIDGGKKAATGTGEPAKPSTGKFNADDVLKQLEVTEYRWVDSIDQHHMALEIKNNSDFGIDIGGSIVFYDENKGMVGAGDSSVDAIPAGGLTLLEFTNDVAFAQGKYELTAKECTYYTPLTQNMVLETNKTETKIIISASNTGSAPIKFASASALFFKDGAPSSLRDGSLSDDDYELKAGKSKTCEIEAYEKYDNVKLYLFGRGEK